MVSFKVVIGTKQGKCYQREVADPDASNLLGKKVGDTISGDLIGLKGYEFAITGGSDHCGFPMRKDVSGASRKRVLTVQDIGVKKKAKGIRRRRTVCGNVIHPKISQINLKVLKEGAEKLGAEAKEEAPAKEEAKPAEKPKAEATPEKKAEPKKEEAPKKEEPAKAAA